MSIKTHSLVYLDSDDLRSNESPPKVIYNGVEGYLLRRISDESIVDLTLTEVRELLNEIAERAESAASM